MAKYRSISNDYIASGAFGSVVKVERKTDGKIIACKSIVYDDKKRKKGLRYAQREAEIFSQLRHPNIARFIDIEWGQLDVKLYMEYYKHGTLGHLIDAQREQNTYLSESYVWMIIWQLSNALVYCHNRKLVLPDNTEKDVHGISILHRDIKPQNVFVSSLSSTAPDTIKLGDFGLGVILSDDHDPYTYVGTRCYKPPEISRKHSVIKWDSKCDIFSLGCTFYEVCNLTAAYPDPMESDQNPAVWLENEKYSDELQNCIRQCIGANPMVRPSARELSQLAYERIKHTTQIQAALKDHALLLAVEEGEIMKVAELLKQGADLGVEDVHSKGTPLHLAAKTNCPALIPLLVTKKCLNKKNASGETPLHCAATAGSGVMIEVLLNEGAKRLVYDDDGWFAIHRAARAGNIETFQSLLERNPDDLEIYTKGPGEMNSLHIAAISGSASILLSLVDKGADVDAELGDGNTAFSLAAKNGHLEPLDILARAKCQMNKPVAADGGRTALLVASQNGSHRVVEHLIKLGCDTKCKDLDDRTSLHIAACAGHTSTIQVLIEAGVDLEVTSSVKGREGWTAMHMVAKEGHLPAAKTLRDAKSNLEARSRIWNTPLHEACAARQFEMMEFLLTCGSKVNAKGDSGATPLHLSASAGEPWPVQMLLQNGADVNARTKDGLTPLLSAASYGRLKVVRILIEHGALLDVRDVHGKNAVELARNNGYGAVMRLLLKSGAPDGNGLLQKAIDVLRSTF